MAFGDAFGFWVEGSEDSCLFVLIRPARSSQGQY